MGIDDRDYMRERRRRESGARLGSASWIDAKGRVEYHGHGIGPPGRGRGNGQDGAGPRLIPHPWQKWIVLLSAISVLVPLYGEAQRKGWLPDFEAKIPFPESGSVTVARSIKRRDISSSLTVAASEANAVVQLFEPDTNAHILSVYVASNNRVTIPAPVGTFRMRLIEGQQWHGTSRYFGPNTAYETVAELMTFEPRSAHVIDLRRNPAGNLKTRMMVTAPAPL